jgi:hypothetical protein
LILKVVDTGAVATLCKAQALLELVPDFRNKLAVCPVAKLRGIGGQTGVLGVLYAEVVLPHHECSLKLDRVEFIVIEDHALPFDFIFGRDTQAMYKFNLKEPTRQNAQLTIGTHPQKWYLDGVFLDDDILELIQKGRFSVSSQRLDASVDFPVAMPSVEERFKELPPDLPGPSVAEELPSGNPNITYDDFIAVLTGDFPPCSEEFRDALKEAQICDDLTEVQRDYVLRVLAANEDAFFIKDREYERSRLGESVKLVVKLPDPFPKTLKRACYPCSHQKEEDMRKHVSKLMKEGKVVRLTSRFAAPTFM